MQTDQVLREAVGRARFLHILRLSLLSISTEACMAWDFLAAIPISRVADFYGHTAFGFETPIPELGHPRA